MMNFREYQPEEIFKNHGRPIKVTYDYFQEKKKELEAKNLPSNISCAIMMYRVSETWNVDTPSEPDIEKVLVYCQLTNFTNNAGFYTAEVKIDSKVPGYEGKTIVLNGTDQYDFPIYRFDNPIYPMCNIILGYHIVMDNNGDVLQLFKNKPEHIVINV